MTTSVPSLGELHALSVADTLELLAVNGHHGLSGEEARRRLRVAGPNVVADQPDTPLWRLALDQFRSMVVLLLLAASVTAIALGEWAESIAILAALLLNAAVGFVSVWRARRSLDRLRALAVPSAVVLRDRTSTRLPSAEIVPGDVVVLEAGFHVPADLRLIHTAVLLVTEAALTGESAPVMKDAEASLMAATPLAERTTMAYLGTAVVSGSGLGVVTATGAATELGRIGQLVAASTHSQTPLERQVEQLGRRLMGLALAICGVVGLAGILYGEPIGLMVETAISLAVAAIPEGLPAVTTLALAAGLWRLARVGGLVRRLPAVETLGSTTVICVDKTGTLTENQMTVVQIVLNDRIIDITGGGRSASGKFHERGATLDARADQQLQLLLMAGVLASNASVEIVQASVTEPELRLHGDPTEAALLVAACKARLYPASIGATWPRLKEFPFDPHRRLMATIHRTPEGGRALFVKGAPQSVLDRSVLVQGSSGARVLDAAERMEIIDTNQRMASDGLRVLAIAWSQGSAPCDAIGIADLTFLGLVGIVDPPRPGVKEALRQCRRAGIRAIMLTGDQRATAEAIGRELGLPAEAVRSRVVPEEKLALVRELQDAGEIVAMTGDGVNDAPALARADIGIAMGRQGTDVAREAADLVLTDDSFSTIVRAVEEGRVIFANLRKVINFLFSCNLSEIIAIFVAILLGYSTPLLPLQILWINLVTNILPALALIRDPAEPEVMNRPARDPREALVTSSMATAMLTQGLLLSGGVLSAFFWAIWQGGWGPHATTIAFVATVMIHALQALNCRSEYKSWWQLPPNPLVWVSMLVLLGLQLLAVSWMPLTALLGTVPLSGRDWLVITVAAAWPVILLEALKKVRSFSGPRHGDAVSCLTA